MNRRLLPWISCFILFVLACAGWQGDLEPPPRHATEAERALQDSTLVLPITVSYETLRTAIASAMPAPLCTLEAQEIAASVVADITVRANGDITLVPRGDTLRMQVPVKVAVDAYRQKANGSRGVSLGEGSAALTLRLDMTFGLGEDWELLTDISPEYRWDRDPTMKIGPISLPVKGLVEEQLDAQLPALADTLEEMIADTKVLRPLVRKAWRSFLQPRQVTSSPAIAVQFAPESLTATDPQTTARGVQLTLGASGPLQVWLGDASQGSDSRSRLPDRQAPTATNDSTRLQLPLYLEWASLTSLAKAQLVGQQFSADLPQNTGTAEAVVTDVLDIYPSGDQLSIGLQLQLSASGQTIDATVWLLATPDIQAVQKTLTLGSFSFVAQTSSTIVNAALAVLSDPIEEAMQSQLSFPLETALDTLLQSANTAFRDQEEVADGIQLHADLTQLTLAGIELTETHLVVHSRISGELEAFVFTP
jgi:hypothetical protein